MAAASARTGCRSVPVEGRAVGVASFDGNHSAHCVSWMFAASSWNEKDVPQMLDQLMVYTLADHLAWVVFPKAGYRWIGEAALGMYTFD